MKNIQKLSYEILKNIVGGFEIQGEYWAKEATSVLPGNMGADVGVSEGANDGLDTVDTNS